MLPNKPCGVPRVDNRRVLKGIFWVLRSGAPWRDLPDVYGPRAPIVATMPTGSGRSSISRALGPTYPRSKTARTPSASVLISAARNLVERFFNKIKQCRRVATRYDKLAANYLALIKLASIRIWLRAYESAP